MSAIEYRWWIDHTGKTLFLIAEARTSYKDQATMLFSIYRQLMTQRFSYAANKNQESMRHKEVKSFRVVINEF